MVPSVSHSRDEETPEAKARWFQSLPIEERMRVFCDMCDMIIAVRPEVLEAKNAQPVSGRVRILASQDLIASKSASGRPVDLEDVRILRSLLKGGPD